jgi:RNA polymerase sigma-70 factor (ECF subfamily)
LVANPDRLQLRERKRVTNDADVKPPVSLHAESSSQTLEPTQSATPESLVGIFEEHRALLFSIGYRMLGGTADAEDMLQETYLRWRGASVAEIQNPRAFLVTVLTRLCINQLQSARAKREQYFGQWLPEPLLTGPAADLPRIPGIDGSLSMAFLTLLERLSPTERAVFLLREVFDYEYNEIAGMLTKSEANCRQIFRRAKQHITESRPRFEVSQQQRERLLQQFVDTSLSGNVQGLLALLAKDVVLYTDGGGKATAVPNPIYGAEPVARFFVGGRKKLLPAGITRRFTEINGQPGVIAYHNGRVFGVLSLDAADGRVQKIYIVRNPDKLARLQHLPSAPY